MGHTPSHPGTDAHAAGSTLTSTRVAALPVLDRVFRRLRLDVFLRDHLPHEGRRARIGLSSRKRLRSSARAAADA